jgi:hypothetical protein
MNYEPKIIFNPNNKEVEFMYDHQSYVFGPGEKKNLNGSVAWHALRMVNAGLKEYVPETDDALVESTNIAYDKMPWKEVVALASARGLFKPGMLKTEVLKALAEADEGA